MKNKYIFIIFIIFSIASFLLKGNDYQCNISKIDSNQIHIRIDTLAIKEIVKKSNVQLRFNLNPEIPDSVKFHPSKNSLKGSYVNNGWNHWSSIYNIEYKYFDNVEIKPINITEYACCKWCNFDNKFKENPKYFLVTKKNNELTGTILNPGNVTVDLGDKYFPQKEIFLVMYDTSRTSDHNSDLRYSVISGPATLISDDYFRAFKCLNISNLLFTTLRLAVYSSDTLPIEVMLIKTLPLIPTILPNKDEDKYEYFYIKNLILPVTKGIPINAFIKIKKGCQYDEFEIIIYTNYPEITGNKDKFSGYEIRQKFCNQPLSFEEIAPQIKKMPNDEFYERRYEWHKSNPYGYPIGNFLLPTREEEAVRELDE